MISLSVGKYLKIVLIVFVLCACSKKDDEPAISIIDKQGEPTVLVEGIPKEFAEKYQGLFVVSEIDGVEWNKGIITATGRGLPPKHITNEVQAKLLAIRAANVEAQKNLLLTIMKMKTPPDRGIKEYIDDKHIEITRIEGFIKGARVVKEEFKEDGSAEVMIQIALTGGEGLIALLK